MTGGWVIHHRSVEGFEVVRCRAYRWHVDAIEAAARMRGLLGDRWVATWVRWHPVLGADHGCRAW